MPLLLCSVFPLLLLLLLPGEALAWGAGVHLQVGSFVLDNLARLPRDIQPLLSACPYDFLYGCISADITIGKKYTHYLKHCHSWRMGRKILKRAATARQKACAYGYLAHLAADTIAHSYYVPIKMVRSFNTNLLKHTYWEMRYESLADPEVWTIAKEIARRDFSEDDALMRSVLSNTLFSFGTNKRLFNSILLLSRLQQWQRMLRTMAHSSRFQLDEENAGEYLLLAREAAMSILAEMERSPYWSSDPTGERALEAARMIRKNLHLLWLDGKLKDDQTLEMLQTFRKRFREGITRPESLLELLSAA